MRCRHAASTDTWRSLTQRHHLQIFLDHLWLAIVVVGVVGGGVGVVAVAVVVACKVCESQSSIQWNSTTS
eukprot:COSAG01_NODE_331_length_18718_cov_21.881358_3_plen_70_part_00